MARGYEVYYCRPCLALFRANGNNRGETQVIVCPSGMHQATVTTSRNQQVRIANADAEVAPIAAQIEPLSRNPLLLSILLVGLYLATCSAYGSAANQVPPAVCPLVLGVMTVGFVFTVAALLAVFGVLKGQDFRHCLRIVVDTIAWLFGKRPSDAASGVR